MDDFGLGRPTRSLSENRPSHRHPPHSVIGSLLDHESDTWGELFLGLTSQMSVSAKFRTSLKPDGEQRDRLTRAQMPCSQKERCGVVEWVGIR